MEWTRCNWLVFKCWADEDFSFRSIKERDITETYGRSRSCLIDNLGANWRWQDKETFTEFIEITWFSTCCWEQSFSMKSGEVHWNNKTVQIESDGSAIAELGQILNNSVGGHIDVHGWTQKHVGMTYLFSRRLKRLLWKHEQSFLTFKTNTHRFGWNTCLQEKTCDRRNNLTYEQRRLRA